MKSLPPITEKTRKILAVSLVLVFAALVLSAYSVRLMPNVMFKYDLDHSDGDMLNNALRIFHGQSIYHDWNLGEINGPYPPLYFYWLAAGKLLAFEPLFFGRMTNVMFVFSAILILAYLLAALCKKPMEFLIVPLFLWLFVIRSENFQGATVYLRSDALLLFIQALGLCLLVLAPKRVFAVTALAVLAGLTKQSGAELGIAALLFYLLTDRASALKFIGYGLALGLSCLALLEWSNGGHFLADTFFYPGRLYQGPKFIETSHALLLWNMYHNERIIFIAAAIIGAILSFFFEPKFKPVALLFAVDLAQFSKIGRNNGGGEYYLWLHWLLASLLIAVLVKWIIKATIHGCQRLRWIVPERFRLITLALVVSYLWLWAGHKIYRHLEMADLPENLAAGFANRAAAEKIANEHLQKVLQVDLQYPNARWYSERLSMAVVHAGNILDHEACTLWYAFTSVNKLDSRKMQAIFLDGKYELAQTTDVAPIPELNTIFADCYKVLHKSETVVGSRVFPVRILHFEPTLESCVALKKRLLL